MKKGKRKKSRLGCLIVVMAIMLAGAYFAGTNLLAGDSPLNPSDTTLRTVEIDKGSTAASISDQLETEGLIKRASSFKSLVKKLGMTSRMQAGTYRFSPSMKPSEMIAIIAGGKTYSDDVKIVIPEGYSNRQIIALLADSGLGKDETYRDVLKNGDFDYRFIKGLNRKHLLEGFLFPATYEFEKDATEYEVIDRMLRKFDSVFKDEYYARAKELGMTMNEVISLAAIVEKEAKRDDERARVASVFHNRLKVDMKLQSCATVQYILGEPKEYLSYDDIAIDSPYNTYKITGLTPAPIASPGEKSIIAALYPETTDYLFFVVTNKGDGSHYFTKTLAEHNAAIEESNRSKPADAN